MQFTTGVPVLTAPKHILQVTDESAIPMDGFLPVRPLGFPFFGGVILGAPTRVISLFPVGTIFPFRGMVRDFSLGTVIIGPPPPPPLLFSAEGSFRGMIGP